MTRLCTALCLAVVGVLGSGCRPVHEPPVVDAVREAFRQGGLTARESHGRRVFSGRCATCHGPEGRGDGQNAYNLSPPPPDFRESLPGLDPQNRRRVIEGGTATLGRSPLCPPWQRSLEAAEIQALLAYLEVLARPAAQEEEEPGRWRRRRPPS